MSMKPIQCPAHKLDMIDSCEKLGRRVILRCPAVGCDRFELKPRQTPKRQKDLVLTEVPLTEHEIQSRFVAECRSLESQYPELELLHSIPNGAFIPFPKQRRILLEEGMLSGVPDMFLPVARRNCHGWYCEFKKPGGGISRAQQDIGIMLVRQGYYVAVHTDWRTALAAVKEYLDAKTP